MPSAEIYDQSSIEAEIAKAQNTLRNVDESLRPLSGRTFRASYDNDGPEFASFRRGAARGSFGGGEERRFERPDEPGGFRSGGGYQRGGFRDRDDGRGPDGGLSSRLGPRAQLQRGGRGDDGYSPAAPMRVGGGPRRSDEFGSGGGPLSRMGPGRRTHPGGAGDPVSLNQRFSGGGPPPGRFHPDPMDYDDDAMPNKPLSSTVVMPIIDTKSRDEAIKEMETTEVKEVKTRNRRLFANLLGTLSGFARESKVKRNTEQEKKQKEVEERLAKEKAQEQEQRKEERQQLMGQRRDAQQKLQTLKRKQAYVQIAEREESRVRVLQNFIQTQTKPPIFYLPAKHTLRTLELHKATKRKLDEQIEARRDKLAADMKMIEESERNKAEREGGRMGGGDRRKRGHSPAADDDEHHDDGDDALEPGEVPAGGAGASSKRRRDNEPDREHSDSESEPDAGERPADVDLEPDDDLHQGSADEDDDDDGATSAAKRNGNDAAAAAAAADGKDSKPDVKPPAAAAEAAETTEQHDESKSSDGEAEATDDA